MFCVGLFCLFRSISIEHLIYISMHYLSENLTQTLAELGLSVEINVYTWNELNKKHILLTLSA